jgi:hypothetical protein
MSPPRGPAAWLAATLCAIALGACAGGDARREQTWPQGYGATTCHEWRKEMTAQQRWVAAAEILLTARRADGGAALPRDGQVGSFARDISRTCLGRSAVVSDVGLGVYIIDKPRYGGPRPPGVAS